MSRVLGLERRPDCPDHLYDHLVNVGAGEDPPRVQKAQQECQEAEEEQEEGEAEGEAKAEGGSAGRPRAVATTPSYHPMHPAGGAHCATQRQCVDSYDHIAIST